MENYIEFEKIWQDVFCYEIKITCVTEIITVINNIYTSNDNMDDLYNKIEGFINGEIEDCIWLNGDKGNDSTAFVSFRFLRKDKLGHVLVEVYLELDDGGDYNNHNCCFYVKTELGLLSSFYQNISKIKNGGLGVKLRLNDL